jgi:glycine oxidase
VSAAGSAKIAIVGGGIVGLSIAWRLCQRGLRVTIFDRQAVGQEASWVGAGMLAPAGEISQPGALSTLLQEARALYRTFVKELEEESGVPIDYQESGGLDLAYASGDLEALLERGTCQSALGIGWEFVEPQRILATWPGIRSAGLTGGLFYANDASVNPREVVSALKTVCLKRGALLQEGQEVAQLDVQAGSVVVNTGERHIFDAAVIAAGAWSSQIPVSGVPPLGAVEPVKGHILAYQQPPRTCPLILRLGHIYLLQRANGILLAGASMERAGFDRTIQPGIAASIAEKAGFVLPCLAGTEPTHTWTGFRPASEEVYMGRWHSNRLFAAYGHFRNGILLAPLTAARIASAVKGQSPIS